MAVHSKVEDPEDVKNIPADTSFGGEQKEQPTANAAENVEVDVSEQSSTVVRISPAAKLLIKEHGLDESLLKASGPRGTLLKGDVLAALKSGAPSSSTKEKKAPAASSSQPTHDSQAQSVITPQKTDTHEDLPNTQIRKVLCLTFVFLSVASATDIMKGIAQVYIGILCYPVHITNSKSRRIQYLSNTN